MTTTLLVARSVRYLSANDEQSFFEWLHRIEAIRKVEGLGSDLYIHVDKDANEESLREIVALFFRYNVDLTQVPKAFGSQMHPWLHSQNAYWYHGMFLPTTSDRSL